jgi:Domain of unknown function (DUF397)
MADRTWRKSSFSTAQGNCVEVCTDATTMAVRDSKSVPGPELEITDRAWSAFIAGVKNGEFAL